ncbi:MAG: hypothetical protein J6B93_01310 [Clostridia bacterium]|nr:hypothetical protein [Clostridia bacterium]
MREKTCCFIGHRKIDDSRDLRKTITDTVEALINDKGVDTFLFGSKSEFNSLCRELVTLLKEKYPHIRRIYVRAEYPFINESYKRYLLESYDDTYYPKRIQNSGRACYIERNHELIDHSLYLVTYFDNKTTTGGTANAYAYALQKGLTIKNVFGTKK